MKEYRLNYRYKDYAWCAFVGIDKRALESKKRELDSDPDFTTREIRETNGIGVLYQDMTTGSQFLNFIQGNAVLIGERHVDSRCTGMRKFYSTPEDKEKAFVDFYKESLGQKRASDRYYSQPWI